MIYDNMIKFTISIHALREESDAIQTQPFNPFSISIHALREESDKSTSMYTAIALVISIHALREESDLYH